MILELILIVAILGIFILIVRRLPEALAEGKTPPVTPLSASTRPAPAFLTFITSTIQGILGRFQRQPTPSTSLVQRPTPTPLVPISTEITEETLLREGDAYLEAGKIKEAERSYLRAVAKDPKQPRLYNRLGAIYLRSRNYGDALQAFEAARDLDGSKASRHYNVALAAWQLGNLAKARASISQAISLDPAAQKYQDLKGQIEQGTA